MKSEYAPGSSPHEEMLNEHIAARLNGIHGGMMAAFTAGSESTAASKGIEREIFISRFLAQVLPSTFRFGHGDIIDTFRKRSGQIDIVIENPFFPSLPIVEHGPRLYLAEGVAAALEIKSNIKDQWDEVRATAEKLNELIPCSGGIKKNSSLAMADCQIPLFAVGFDGWCTLNAVEKRVEDGIVDAIFIVNKGVFCAHKKYRVRNVEGDPAIALWLFLCCLHDRVTSIASISTTPLIYLTENRGSGQTQESD